VVGWHCGDAAALAAAGSGEDVDVSAGIGIFSIYRGAKVAGTVCLLAIAPFLAKYGFLLAFAAMGGSR
jgi:hypothetical protein